MDGRQQTVKLKLILRSLPTWGRRKCLSNHKPYVSPRIDAVLVPPVPKWKYALVCLPFPCLPLHQTQIKNRTNSNHVSPTAKIVVSLLQTLPLAQPNARLVLQLSLSYRKDCSSSSPCLPLCADLFGAPRRLTHACMVGGPAPCSISTAAEGARGPHGNGSGTAVGNSVHVMGT